MNTAADTDLHSNDLTQLSSREQLYALMDSALPADQTRFLLRRLQHDATLAECWERWRTAGEVMRGLAPARRLPADFASRVSGALHGDAAPAQPVRNARSPAWLRWGGGAAVAASLAVVALMARQPAQLDAPQPVQVAADSAAQPEPPAPMPAQPAPAIETGSQLATAATAVAAVVRPQRDARRRDSRAGPRLQPAAQRPAEATAQVAALVDSGRMPAVQALHPDIVTRPWPRSVLPQYAGGGLAVGFGEHVRGVPYNPFQPQMQAPDGVGMPPATESAGDPAQEPQAAAAEPQPEAPAQP